MKEQIRDTQYTKLILSDGYEIFIYFQSPNQVKIAINILKYEASHVNQIYLNTITQSAAMILSRVVNLTVNKNHNDIHKRTYNIFLYEPP